MSRNYHHHHDSYSRYDNPEGVTVTLLFKHTIKSNFVFRLSYNEAMQSGFLIPLLESEGEKQEYVYEIPKKLYERTREVDLKQFYHLWIGKEVFSKLDVPHGRYDYKQILRLIQVFNLNEELPFVERLESVYPPLIAQNKQNEEEDQNGNDTYF